MGSHNIFTTHSPDSGAFPTGTIMGKEPKTIQVRGKEVKGWIVTVVTGENNVHPMLQVVEDGE